MIISGTVRDDGGRPVAWARVLVAGGPGPYPDVAALTADDGTFQLSVASPGRYRLECHAVGFSPAVVEVSAGAAATPPADITLEPDRSGGR